jgi:hypothetical protein
MVSAAGTLSAHGRHSGYSRRYSVRIALKPAGQSADGCARARRAHSCPHLRQDCGSPLPTSAPELRLTPATSAPELRLATAHISARTAARSRPHLRRNCGSPLPTSAPGLRLAAAHICARTCAHSRLHWHRPPPSSAHRVAAHPCPQLRQGLRRARVRVDLCLCVCVCVRRHVWVCECVRSRLGE